MRIIAIVGLITLLVFFGYNTFNGVKKTELIHSSPRIVEVIEEEVDE